MKPTNHYERLIAAGRAADDDPGENLSHLRPREMAARLISDGKILTADLDWSECPAATRTDGIVSGQWRVRGTRIPVDALITNYNAGYSADQLATKIFEGLPVDLAREVIGFAFERTP